MPVNLSIKNVPEELNAALKARAAANHRSLQKEVLAVLEDAVRGKTYLKPSAVLQQVRALGISSRSESAGIVRRMRDTRYGR